MKRQRGFTLVEVLVLLAILAAIVVVIALNIGLFSPAKSPADMPAYNVTQMDALFSKPLSSLNATELHLLADYCTWRSNEAYSDTVSARWAIRATVYQNQLIIRNDQ